MIELKENDLVKVKTKKDGEIQLAVIEKVNVLNKNMYHYLASDNFGFDDNFMDGFKRHEIIAVWRYNGETGNFLKIYDKDIEERVKNARPIKADNTKFYTEPCQSVKPADVSYDKYISLQSENAELKNIIVELNKKLYENNQIH
jgi:hypothetical protein